ncbi:hypothetical protein ACU639_18865 [Streptomyces cynarae]
MTPSRYSGGKINGTSVTRTPAPGIPAVRRTPYAHGNTSPLAPPLH